VNRRIGARDRQEHLEAARQPRVLTRARDQLLPHHRVRPIAGSVLLGVAHVVGRLRRITAVVPDQGETVFQILGGSGSALAVPDPTTVLDLVGYPGAPEGDVEAFLKPATVHESFAQDLPEADRWLIVESQRPITLSANTTQSGASGWTSLPSWAVVGTEDRVIPPGTQRSMAERAGATISEVAASHVSMVSRPQAAIDAVLAAAAAVGD
jgi:pimeloyl-ACP methyl ester carboxylesterase